MDNKDYTTEYRTGEVAPPKNYRWPLTLVLLAVIFVGGLVSALSFWGVRLSLMLARSNRQADASVHFVEEVRLTTLPEAEEFTQIKSLDIHGRFLTEFDQRYFDLPQGIYISQLSYQVPDLCIGDVLLRINGEPVTNQDVLNALIDSHAHGAALSLDIFRNGKPLTLSAVLIKDFEEATP